MTDVAEQYTEFVVGSSFDGGSVDLQARITGTSNPADWFVDLLGGTVSDSGQRVDGWTALTSGPVWQAISIISGSVMSLPIEIIQTVSDSPKRTKKRTDLPAWKLMREEPHPEYLPSAFKELLEANADLHGNGLARIVRGPGNEPIQLVPMAPNSTYLERDEDGTLFYMFTPSTDAVKQIGGDVPAGPIPFRQNEIFHIIGPHGGLWGTSIVDVAKNSIGHAIALEKHGNAVFKNAARPSGVLEKDGSIGAESRRNLRQEWNEVMAGAENAGKPIILWDGIKWKPMSLSNEDAQWLEARRFSREDIASWFNLPPHMLGALENSSVRANLEEQNKSFYFHSLRPRLIKWQDEIYRKLFTAGQRNRRVFSVRFNANALLSADFETRMKGHATGRQWGWLSANDVLEIEDMDDIGEKGDSYMVPANMVNAETGEMFGKQPEPEPPPPQEPPEQPPGAPSSNEDEQPNTLAYLRPALISELTKAVRLESQKIQQAAKRASKDKDFNFCGFLDDFYDDAFSTIICDNLQPLVSVAAQVSRDVLEVEPSAAIYCAESKDFWLSVAETTTSEKIYLDVTERIGRWADRAHMAADMILEGNGTDGIYATDTQ